MITRSQQSDVRVRGKGITFIVILPMWKGVHYYSGAVSSIAIRVAGFCPTSGFDMVNVLERFSAYFVKSDY